MERQQARHEAALARIEAETAAQKARAVAFITRWKAEHTARCGTAAGYAKHRREDTEACKPCVEANRAANRKADQRKQAKRKAAEAAGKHETKQTSRR